jgi:hypothetical protein
MKEHKIEKTKVEITYEYEAIDGSLFKSKEECKKYEESAAMVVYSKYKPLVIDRKKEYAIYQVGSDEYEIDIVKIKCPEDIDILLHMYSLYHPSRDVKDLSEERVKLNTWFNDNEIVFIGRGCRYDNYDGFEFLGTMNSLINDIKKACNEEKV